MCSRDKNITNDEKGLLEGWTVEMKTYNSGTKAGKQYKCYIAPVTGLKFYTMGEVSRYQKGEASRKCKSRPAEQIESISEPERSGVMQSKDDVLVERREAEGLPAGWIHETVVRKGNKSRKDPYYIDPETGYAFRSKPDARRYLDTGDINQCAIKPKKRDINSIKATNEEASVPAKAKWLKVKAVKNSMSDEVADDGQILDSPVAASLPFSNDPSPQDEREKLKSHSDEELLDGHDLDFSLARVIPLSEYISDQGEELCAEPSNLTPLKAKVSKRGREKPLNNRLAPVEGDIILASLEAKVSKRGKGSGRGKGRPSKNGPATVVPPGNQLVENGEEKHESGSPSKNGPTKSELPATVVPSKNQLVENGEEKLESNISPPELKVSKRGRPPKRGRGKGRGALPATVVRTENQLAENGMETNESNTNESNKMQRGRKRKEKKELDTPRRSSKRLAAIGAVVPNVDVSPSGEALEHSMAKAEQAVHVSEQINQPESTSLQFNQPEQETSFAFPSKSAKNHKESEVLIKESVHQEGTEEQPCEPAMQPGAQAGLEKLEMEKSADKEPESLLTTTFVDDITVQDYLQDPCLDFAFKTLTGAISVTEDYLLSDLGSTQVENTDRVTLNHVKNIGVDFCETDLLQFDSLENPALETQLQKPGPVSGNGSLESCGGDVGQQPGHHVECKTKVDP